MKINLFVNEDDQKSDMINVGRVGDLRDYVELGEANEIVALNVLDYIPLHAIPMMLGDWCSRVRRGGEISIGGSSYRSIARSIFREEFSLEEVNALLYGTGDLSSGPPKRSLLSLEWVENFLVENGFKVVQKRIEQTYFFIKGVRK